MLCTNFGRNNTISLLSAPETGNDPSFHWTFISSTRKCIVPKFSEINPLVLDMMTNMWKVYDGLLRTTNKINLRLWLIWNPWHWFLDKTRSSLRSLFLCIPLLNFVNLCSSYTEIVCMYIYRKFPIYIFFRVMSLIKLIAIVFWTYKSHLIACKKLTRNVKCSVFRLSGCTTLPTCW